MKVFFIFFVVFLSAHQFKGLNAQVLNIDREVKEDTAYKGWSLTGKFSISSDKQRNNVLDLDTKLELDRFFTNHYVLVGYFRNSSLSVGSQSVQNYGQYHLRFRDQDTRKISIEAFLQDQWNGAWGMEGRFLLGANVRMRFFEQKAMDLYTATGIFYERERWNWNGVRKDLVPRDANIIARSMYRLNQYLKFSQKLTETIDLTSVTYFQFPINGPFFKPRWYFESNVNVTASKRLGIVLHWDHILDGYTAVPIDRFYYSFSTGLQVSF